PTNRAGTRKKAPWFRWTRARVAFCVSLPPPGRVLRPPETPDPPHGPARICCAGSIPATTANVKNPMTPFLIPALVMLAPTTGSGVDEAAPGIELKNLTQALDMLDSMRVGGLLRASIDSADDE